VASPCAQCQLPLPTHPFHDESGALAFCCSGCLLVYRIVGASGDEGSASWFLAKLGLAAILSGNVMMFQSLLYFGSFQSMGAEVWRTASWIMLALSLGVFLILGVPMLRLAYHAAREGRLVLETLIATGALASIVASAWATFHGGTLTYYDSGTMVLVFVVLGQYLDARARESAARALRRPVERLRRLARVRREGRETEVDPSGIAPGERIYVRPGEEIPVDGRILEGRSDISEPGLTGESVPWTADGGAAVRAGSVAVDGALTVEATGASESLAERIALWTARARAGRGLLEATADRMVGWFIPLVALVAVSSALYWGLERHVWAKGGLAALSVLVIACPCALGIATPLATTVSIARAASCGVLVRSGAVLEALAGVDLVAFDKTGTLTEAEPRVSRVRYRGAPGIDRGTAWSLAAAVESQVPHPFAGALVRHAREEGAREREAVSVRAVPGGGAEGRVEGREVLVGSPAFLEARLGGGTGNGAGVGVAIDGELVLEADFEDPPRPEAAAAIQALHAQGLSVSVLSGDKEAAVGPMRELGCDRVMAGLLPDGKAEAVRALGAEGHRVAMVGDGLNDAPALGAARAGIAFAGAPDLARQTADVVVLKQDLLLVPGVLRLARRTRGIVVQNLLWAFVYNAVGIGAAAAGVLRPVVAAAAMVLSSLCVVGNSLRLRSAAPKGRTEGT
jgi:Cu2+-exporting ATPase